MSKIKLQNSFKEFCKKNSFENNNHQIEVIDLLEKFINDNDLIVVNSSNICEGAITRRRVTVNSIEESVIDYFIVCRRFYEYVVKMKIDEEGVYTLTKFATKKGKKSVKKSDHNMLILYLNISWNSFELNPASRSEDLPVEEFIKIAKEYPI